MIQKGYRLIFPLKGTPYAIEYDTPCPDFDKQLVILYSDTDSLVYNGKVIGFENAQIEIKRFYYEEDFKKMLK